MKKKSLFVIIAVGIVILAVVIFLLSKRYCLTPSEGFIGEWWPVPTPDGGRNMHICCPLGSLCL